MKRFGIVILKVFFVLYVLHLFLSVFTSQQRMLDTYAAEKKQYNEEILVEEENNKELSNTLDSLNTTEYIEHVAREKLDMYLPNERVYIDIDK